MSDTAGVSYCVMLDGRIRFGVMVDDATQGNSLTEIPAIILGWPLIAQSEGPTGKEAMEVKHSLSRCGADVTSICYCTHFSNWLAVRITHVYSTTLQRPPYRTNLKLTVFSH